MLGSGKFQVLFWRLPFMILNNFALSDFMLKMMRGFVASLAYWRLEWVLFANLGC